MPTTGSYPTLRAALPTPPANARDFIANDTVSALVNVFGPDSRKGNISLVWAIQAEDGREVLTERCAARERKRLA